MKKTVILFILCCPAMFLMAEDIVSTTKVGVDAAYYIDDNRGYGGGSFVMPDYTPVELPDDFTPLDGDEGRNLGSGWGAAEAKIWLSHSIQMPFMTGNTPLTSGNNLNFRIKTSLSPVTADIYAAAVLTPIAMLQFEAGGLVGSGWAALGFNGMGLKSGENNSGITTEDNLSGVVSKLWCKGTFQFDLAAVKPGDWNHVVAAASGKLEYQNYSNADSDDPWVWQADSGENFNGFRYLGTYLLGYQMPIKVSTAGILIETRENLGDVRDMSTLDDGGWGSDFRYIRIAPLAVIDITESSSLTVLFQFSNERRYTEETVFYNYFENREYEDTFWKFRRIALSWSMTL